MEDKEQSQVLVQVSHLEINSSGLESAVSDLSSRLENVLRKDIVVTPDSKETECSSLVPLAVAMRDSARRVLKVSETIPDIINRLEN